MSRRAATRIVGLVVVVVAAALSLGCEDVGGVGIGSGYPHGGAGPTTPMGVGTVWVGGPAWN